MRIGIELLSADVYNTYTSMAKSIDDAEMHDKIEYCIFKIRGLVEIGWNIDTAMLLFEQLPQEGLLCREHISIMIRGACDCDRADILHGLAANGQAPRAALEIAFQQAPPRALMLERKTLVSLLRLRAVTQDA